MGDQHSEQHQYPCGRCDTGAAIDRLASKIDAMSDKLNTFQLATLTARSECQKGFESRITRIETEFKRVTAIIAALTSAGVAIISKFWTSNGG